MTEPQVPAVAGPPRPRTPEPAAEPGRYRFVLAVRPGARLGPSLQQLVDDGTAVLAEE